MRRLLPDLLEDVADLYTRKQVVTWRKQRTLLTEVPLHINLLWGDVIAEELRVSL